MNSFDDDDGIIDLKALASTPPPRGPVVAPLFSEPPGAVSLDASGEADVVTKRSKTTTFLAMGGGAVVVVGIVIAIALAFRGEKPAAAASLAPPPPVVAALAAPPPLPAPAAEPAPASASDDMSPAPATGAKKKKIASGARYTPSSGGAVAPKPAKPAASPCGCKSGDFQCAIRCSAGK